MAIWTGGYDVVAAKLNGYGNPSRFWRLLEGIDAFAPAEKHLGPGSHPDGSPQSVHGHLLRGRLRGTSLFVVHGRKITLPTKVIRDAEAGMLRSKSNERPRMIADSSEAYPEYIPGGGLKALGAPKGHPAFRANAVVGAYYGRRKADLALAARLRAAGDPRWRALMWRVDRQDVQIKRWLTARNRLLKIAFVRASGRVTSDEKFGAIVHDATLVGIARRKAIKKSDVSPPPTVADRLLDAVAYAIESKDGVFTDELLNELEDVFGKYDFESQE